MQLTADEVLRTFLHDEITLFLGASFATVGLIAMMILAIRRRFEPLLFWLGLFAILYGCRLWTDTGLMRLIAPRSDFFDKMRMASSFVIAIPAFLFFRATGLLARIGNLVAYWASGLQLCFLIAMLLGVPIRLLDRANSLLVVFGLLLLAFQAFRTRATSRDMVVVRSGLLVFIVFALWTNIRDFFAQAPNIEHYGFAVFLACLGYVAVRRAIEGEQQLHDLTQELEIAKRIQLSILPGEFPSSKSFRVAARYVPMRSVAGDYYDFLVGSDTEAGLLIADVSGHGVPAALIASMVKMAASSQRASIDKPAELLTAMNDSLCGNTQDQFITAAYVHLDAELRKLRYSAAAHPPMLLLRKGEVTPIQENGLMLALFPQADYTCATQDLEPGDRILLYTDGITEAANDREEQFGLERLSKLLRETAEHTHKETIDRIISAVQSWASSQEDDLTVIVCDYIPAS